MAPKVVVGGGHKYKPETSWIARLSRATRVPHKTYVARGIASEQLEMPAAGMSEVERQLQD